MFLFRVEILAPLTYEVAETRTVVAADAAEASRLVKRAMGVESLPRVLITRIRPVRMAAKDLTGHVAL